MKKLNYLSVLLIALLTFSCGNSLKQENESLKSDLSVLKTTVANLEAELLKYQMSPEKLLAEAKEYYESGKFAALNNVLERITEYHPESKERMEISNLHSNLRTTIDKKEAKEKAERLSAVNRMKKKYDDVSRTTWYKNPYFTHYTNSNRLSIYIGQSDDSVWMRLMMSYYGDNWIFFEDAYLSYDGNTKAIPFDKYKNKKTENSGGGVWEWIDVTANKDLISYLKDFSKSTDAKMRLSGKYTKTRNLTQNERKGISDIIMAYEVLLEELK